MKRYWYKTYVSNVLSQKMMQMPHWLFHRLSEFEAIAADCGGDGLLPPVDSMAWVLRPATEEQLLEALRALEEIGEATLTPDGWRLSNFKEQQESESADRVRRFRERNALKRDVTEVTEEALPSPLLSFNLEGGGLGEGDLQIPQTVMQARAHPDIQLFEEISDVFPGDKDYAAIVTAMHQLRAKHNGTLKAYLVPFWTAWVKGRTKEGKPYRKTNPAWLTEWALNGEIPGESALTNGAAYRPYVPPEKEIRKSAPPPKPAGLRDLTKKLSSKKALRS